MCVIRLDNQGPHTSLPLARTGVLDRTQPGLPLKRGRAGTMTHDYIRNGTTTLFAALNVLDGSVIGQCMARHRHQEFIRFLNRIETAVPAGKLIHAILDNYAVHKHPEVRAWLTRHTRRTFHFTPTSCSWANAVEGFFATLTRRALATRRLPFAAQPPGRDQPLSRRAQPQTQTVLDRRPRPHHRKGQSWASSGRVRPLAAPGGFTGGPVTTFRGHPYLLNICYLEREKTSHYVFALGSSGCFGSGSILHREQGKEAARFALFHSSRHIFLYLLCMRSSLDPCL